VTIVTVSCKPAHKQRKCMKTWERKHPFHPALSMCARFLPAFCSACHLRVCVFLPSISFFAVCLHVYTFLRTSMHLLPYPTSSASANMPPISSVDSSPGSLQRRLNSAIGQLRIHIEDTKFCCPLDYPSSPGSSFSHRWELTNESWSSTLRETSASGYR
jgi:hypothetical protein